MMRLNLYFLALLILLNPSSSHASFNFQKITNLLNKNNFKIILGVASSSIILSSIIYVHAHNRFSSKINLIEAQHTKEIKDYAQQIQDLQDSFEKERKISEKVYLENLERNNALIAQISKEVESLLEYKKYLKQ